VVPYIIETQINLIPYNIINITYYKWQLLCQMKLLQLLLLSSLILISTLGLQCQALPIMEALKKQEIQMANWALPGAKFQTPNRVQMWRGQATTAPKILLLPLWPPLPSIVSQRLVATEAE
jgi:hypothetical protein